MSRRHGLSFLFLLAFVARVPSLQAQCPPPGCSPWYSPEIYVVSIITIESGLVSAECGADVVNPTASYYRGVNSDCGFLASNSAAESSNFPHWQCNSWLETSCSGPVAATGSGSGTETGTQCNPAPGTDTPPPNCSNASGVPVTPGQLYSITATHALWPFFAGDVGYFVDPLDYWDNPVFFSQSSFLISPNINPGAPDFLNPVPECFDSECGIELAITEDFVTAVGITPSFDSLGPTQTEDFTSNLPSVWLLSGAGSLVGSGTTAHYTAPTHVSSETTVQIQACEAANRNNCAVAEVTLVPIDVFVTPPVVDLIPGVAQKFDASINFTDLSAAMAWSVIPAPVAPAAIDANTGLYTPPPPAQVTSPQTVTIKACSKVDSERCGTASATVKPVTITISAPANPFLASAGATLQFSASVVGTNDIGVTWTVAATTTPPTAVGSIDASGLYQGPTPVLTVKQNVQVKACLIKNNAICSSLYTLTIVPPVVIAAVMPAFNAGQTLPVTITGTGFGSNPLVTISDPSISFTHGTLQNPNSLIQGTVSVFSSTPAEVVTVTVTDTDSGLFLAPQASVGVAVNPVTITAAITPTTATLQEGQSQQLNPVFTCRTAGGVVCSVPQTPIWSLNPNLGTLTPGGLYTATASISAQTQVFGKACAAVSPLVCATFIITLTPTTVAISPSSVQLTDGRTQQFTATVTGNSVTSVLWSITPAVGTISTAGLYTAPNPVAGQQAITVKACSTVDNNRCGSATVTLIAVRLSPTTLTFAPQAVGTSSSAQVVTLTNGSPSTLTISSIVSSSSEFTLGAGGTCGTSLAANASCFVNVVFTPTAAGLRTGTLTATDSPANSPQTVLLSGTGTQVSLSPPSLSFDPQNVNTNSGKTLTLINSSPSPLAITGITAPSPFLLSNNCGTSLAANASCTITVTFSPTTAGSFAGVVTVTDNAANSPQTASLSGTGVLIPALSSLTPSLVTVGSTGFTLVVNGANFILGYAVVEVNGQPRPTTFVSPMQVKAAIPASDLAALGQLNVSVLNQSPYLGQSSTLPLTVTSTPIPLIGSLSPARVVVGSPSFTLLVNGSNFASDSAVQINGVSRTAVFNSSGQLAVDLSAADVAHSSLINIGVSNPSTGSNSNAVVLPAFRYGDLNFDDVINVTDLSMIANYMAGNLTLPENATGDVLLDGQINVQDLNTLANYLAGNIHSLPVVP